MTIQEWKDRLAQKFAVDGIETTQTVAAIVAITKDFGEKVAVQYFPLLQIVSDATGQRLQPCDLGAQVKDGVFPKGRVVEWRETRNELFGAPPKGILQVLLRRDTTPETNAYLFGANKKGRELAKEGR